MRNAALEKQEGFLNQELNSKGIRFRLQSKESKAKGLTLKTPNTE